MTFNNNQLMFNNDDSTDLTLPLFYHMVVVCCKFPVSVCMYVLYMYTANCDSDIFALTALMF